VITPVVAAAAPVASVPVVARCRGSIDGVSWRSAEAGAASAALRSAISVALLSTTVLQSIGVNFGSYSLNAALLGMYGCLGVAALSGALVLSRRRLAGYAACITLALASLLVNANFAQVDRSSLASYLLLVVMYLPFIFTLSSETLSSQRGRPIPRGESGGPVPTARWALRHFSDIALFCAGAGILQFFAQSVIHADWLFNFSAYLPPFLRGPEGYNTVIPVGSWLKSNGFFFREPSGFSFIMALALVAEWELGKRWVRMGTFALALLLTYSGTGILALLIAMLFPLGWKTIQRFLLLALGGAALLLAFGDALNLSFTLDRIQEFGSERSSAYIRYVAPMRMVVDTLGIESWTPWLGQGPGAIFRQTLAYEFHDPTWAKLLVEYGLLGSVAFIALFASVLFSGALASPIRVALFAYWLGMGGHLLSPEVNFMALVLAGLLPSRQG
jgi:hypothetical protein